MQVLLVEQLLDFVVHKLRKDRKLLTLFTYCDTAGKVENENR